MLIDWVSGAWYFGDSEREALYVCSASLLHCRLAVERGLDKLRGAAIDPAAGALFYAVWGGAPPAVWRAALDGSEPRLIAAHKLVYPTALTLELATRTLYWADAYLELVERADYEGGARATVRRAYRGDNARAFGVLAGELYLPLWSERAVAEVSRFPRNHSRRDAELTSRPSHALVFHRQRQPRLLHPCAENSAGCSDICVTAWGPAGEGVARCLCRHGYRLAGRTQCIRKYFIILHKIVCF